MISIKVAGSRMGISRSKLYQLVQRRAIAHYRIGGKILFSEEIIEQFLAESLVPKGAAKERASSAAPKSTGFRMLDGERLRREWRKQGVLAPRPDSKGSA